uniref:class I SAM-dependent methyltransferase n=2 Tax=Yoonia sp. TaxID=2212373 RepID=UPI004047D358
HMVTVTQHYDAYPYPARDPKDEAKRLIVGSPSQPVEIDHFVFGGKRDWSVPIKILVAGGGSGDGLIQLAQGLTSAKRPYDITYIDLSTSARQIAQERARIRGLTGISFITGSLLDAGDLGPFDYIDCCGVLHHLPDPAAGFAALRAAVAPHGGMGFMVYAPYGRSGVYPLQEAFSSLLAGCDPKQRLARARAIYARLPADHPFKKNARVGDHLTSDAGFYDLLLHGQDRAFDVPDLLGVLAQTDWSLVGFCKPAQYDPQPFLDAPCDLPAPAAMAVAEKLRGSIKVHVGYAVPVAAARQPATGKALSAIPHISGGKVSALAKIVHSGKPVALTSDGEKLQISLDPRSAAAINLVNGQRTLGEIAQRADLDPLQFGSLWAAVHDALTGWGLLHYSQLYR